MRILTSLTYYRPHYSGLTIYAERLACSLARRGNAVTVLTSRYDRSLPPRERQDGVEIIRPEVLMHISKGVIMPSILFWAWKIIRQSDVLLLHVPQLDAAPISLLARLMGKPVVLTYHCDLYLPSGFIHFIANQVSHIANHISAIAAQAIVTNTRDYAENSPFLRRYIFKVKVIPPPVELPPAAGADIQEFRRKARIQPGQRIIGMAARFATEKGVEYLVEAMPVILKKYPRARVLFMGQYQNVLGEELYIQKLAPLIASLDEAWTFLGNLSPAELAVFYQECEVTVLPSINSTESFGMVQVEAMYCGTPVVATDIPGVRQPVKMTGMGRIIPPANAEALAQAILEILDRPEDYRKDVRAVIKTFSPETIAAQYEELFKDLILRERG
ncbi:MAG TPA: glycosyltransferase family 4 protein [Anaerolineales bacterium]|nr:glycosyltransferase family 4 protein [Anaerolineales bacterium]